MITLRLGVKDVPYPQRRRGRRSDPRRTTAQVAAILEEHYHIIDVFYEMFEHEINADIEEAMALDVEGITHDPYKRIENRIQRRFRQALDNRVFDGVIHDVPTKAASRGINHRSTHPYSRANSPRPSFVDTGMYRKNFTAWID